jgi:uncharacterized protein YbjT (DUF2867 family)
VVCSRSAVAAPGDSRGARLKSVDLKEARRILDDAEDLILVTGATGNTGSALLQQLEGRGARVRAMVRSDKDGARLPQTGASVVVANFDEPRSLEEALKGVTHAYLVTPSSQDAEAQQVRFAERSAAAGSIRTL